MKNKNYDKEWELINKAIANLKRQSEVFADFENVVGINPESKVSNSFNAVGELLINTMSFMVDDEFEFISWYIYQNEFGKLKLSEAINDNLKEIRNLKLLRKLIESHY